MGSAAWGTSARTVSCPQTPFALAYCNNTIATSFSHQITILDGLTGSQTAVLSGHTAFVCSLAFSLDGTLLVSGSWDETVKLWDVQTGGIIKTFCGHTDVILSVSISTDNTMIASASSDETICLWNIKTRDCHIIERYEHEIATLTFSPTNPQLLLSSSNDGILKQWGIDGHQIGSPITGYSVAFSPDGTQFVSYNRKTVTVRNTNSRMTVAEFNQANKVNCCLFSPDGRFIATTTTVDSAIHLWDITKPEPCLIQTLIGHTGRITCLAFPSPLSLISASDDESIKFWQIGTSSADLVVPNSEPTLLHSSRITSVSLQAKDGLAFSLDHEGVVKTWDILAGCCKESYKTKIYHIDCGDMQLVNDRLIVVWYERYGDKINVWDAERDRLQTVASKFTNGLRITGDGSRVLQVDGEFIQAWYIWTGESAGKEKLGEGNNYFNPLRMDGSKVLVQSRESPVQGWDFGIPGSTPIQFSETSSDRPHLNCIDIKEWSRTSPIRIEDSVIGKEVFQLYGRYADPSVIQWDGQYLIAGYMSGEVLILDFGHVLV